MKRLRFLLALSTKENDFQLEQAASAQQAARQTDVDLEIVYADNDPITQSTQLLKVIQADASTHPKMIILQAAGGTALPQAARAAVSAGIGWALLNRHADYITTLRQTSSVPVFSISSDHQEIGKIQGKQFAALLPRGGSVLYIQGPSESVAAKERTSGMQSVLPPGIQITALRGRWTEESGYRCIDSWLRLTVSQKANIHLISGHNDAMVMGARKAIEELKEGVERARWLQLPYTGVDGLPKTGQAWVRTGSLTATVVVPPNAGQAVMTAAEAIRTNSIVPEMSLTTPLSFPALQKLSG